MKKILLTAIISCFLGYIIGKKTNIHNECCPYYGHPHHEIKHNLFFASGQNICLTDSLINETDFKNFSQYECK